VAKYKVTKLDGTELQEPFFVLRAQDILSAGAVMVYSELVYAAANALSTGGRTDEASRLMALAAEVREIGLSFYNWQLRNQTKLPD